MSDIHAASDDLVTANRILAHEEILDAYGHVSIRHPEDPTRFVMSRSRPAELVELDDILEFHLDGTPVKPDGPTPFLERFIHGAIYESRQNVGAVCHNHATSILPFTIVADVQLRAVTHMAGFMDSPVPVWDMAADFGDHTDLLVRNIEQGRSLAASLGTRAVALMRGHGSVVVADDLGQVVSNSIQMDKNARVMSEAARLGPITPLSPGELETIKRQTVGRGTATRGDWEVWKRRAGR
jgi:HCOMODA/2-hydroxy-3-carboxy-muconic semialdehyde decarboxylase